MATAKILIDHDVHDDHDELAAATIRRKASLFSAERINRRVRCERRGQLKQAAKLRFTYFRYHRSHLS